MPRKGFFGRFSHKKTPSAASSAPTATDLAGGYDHISSPIVLRQSGFDSAPGSPFSAVSASYSPPPVPRRESVPSLPPTPKQRRIVSTIEETLWGDDDDREAYEQTLKTSPKSPIVQISPMGATSPIVHAARDSTDLDALERSKSIASVFTTFSTGTGSATPVRLAAVAESDAEDAPQAGRDGLLPACEIEPEKSPLAVDTRAKTASGVVFGSELVSPVEKSVSPVENGHFASPPENSENAGEKLEKPENSGSPGSPVDPGDTHDPARAPSTDPTDISITNPHIEAYQPAPKPQIVTVPRDLPRDLPSATPSTVEDVYRDAYMSLMDHHQAVVDRQRRDIAQLQRQLQHERDRNRDLLNMVTSKKSAESPAPLKPFRNKFIVPMKIVNSPQAHDAVELDPVDADVPTSTPMTSFARDDDKRSTAFYSCKSVLDESGVFEEIPFEPFVGHRLDASVEEIHKGYEVEKGVHKRYPDEVGAHAGYEVAKEVEVHAAYPDEAVEEIHTGSPDEAEVEAHAAYPDEAELGAHYPDEIGAHPDEAEAHDYSDEASAPGNSMASAPHSPQDVTTPTIVSVPEFASNNPFKDMPLDESSPQEASPAASSVYSPVKEVRRSRFLDIMEVARAYDAEVNSVDDDVFDFEPPVEPVSSMTTPGVAHHDKF
ncbi:hypothetical protein DICA2_E08768 [Diutina catenulata]